MIQRLVQALEYIEAVPEDVQEELAEEIENYSRQPARQAQRSRAFAGIWSDLPDDMEDALLRWRREAPPTPFPLDEPME